MKVLLTGGNGMLGRTIVRVLGDRFEIVPTDLPEADITDENCIDRVIAEVKPDAVIHKLPPMPDWHDALKEFMKEEFGYGIH